MAIDDRFKVVQAVPLLIIGDEAKQVAKVVGLLINIVPDPKYENKVRYVLSGRAEPDYPRGRVVEIGGTVGLARIINRSHLGCICQLRFVSKERSGQNTYKNIEVRICKREETTDEEKASYPQWADFNEDEQSPAQNSLTLAGPNDEAAPDVSSDPGLAGLQ